MEARNRDLEKWFGLIESGKVRLPRFQRFEAWRYPAISSILESVLNGLPVGVALILEVEGEEVFHSRPLKGVAGPFESCSEHLLDGQQRLTALWRALNDDYEDRAFLIEETEDGDIRVSPKWPRKWMKDPAKCWERGFVPVHVACPGSDGEDRANAWTEKAAGKGPEGFEKFKEITQVVNRYRHKVAKFNIPFLSLPSSTTGDTAINVFVKMNTNHVRLTAFDIVVAQFEARTGESLHERLEHIKAQVPRLATYRSNIENALLHVAALREEMPLRKSSFLGLDLKRLLDDFPQIEEGLNWAVGFLRQERIFDKRRLPTADVIPVLAALHPHLPKGPDELGNATGKVRAYLWRAFATNRYESGMNTGTLQDLKGMVEELKSGQRTAHIFDEDRYPLPSTRELLRAGWPRTRTRLSRAVLGASLRQGALDLADGSWATAENLGGREYHHLFPEAYLKEHLPEGDSDLAQRALNCVLISWATNRRIGAKPPLVYLRERIDKSTLGEEEIRRRLESHLIPWEEFSSDSPDVPQAYRRFLEARAELMVKALHDLCNGGEPKGS